MDHELQPPPYSSDSGKSHRGYRPLSREGPGMDTGYAPAPPRPVFSSQQQQSNVVVVNQPAAPQMTTEVTIHSAPSDYLTLTIVLMVLCGLHANLLAFVCLIPALCFAIAASSHNDAGDYNSASSFGKAALCCNILVILYFILLVIGVVVVVVLYFTIGLSFIDDAKDQIDDVTDQIEDAVHCGSCTTYSCRIECNYY